MRYKSFIGIVILLFAYQVAYGQSSKEQLLSKNENAYNPIPSPDGTKIAYIRTGWGRNYPVISMGRSNLISEVKVIDSDGTILTGKPLADTFLGGWTPDGRNLICYRDYKYFLVSLDGTKSKATQIPYDQWSQHDKSERGAYLSSIDAIIFVQHLYQPRRGVIRTIENEIARNKTAQIGVMLIPSPDGRYIAAVDVTRWADDLLWVYDTQNKTWVNLGKASIHPEIIYPNNDWDWKNATWDPWFADSSRLAFISGTVIVVSTPDGRNRQTINIPSGTIGLATPSPDGKRIAYVVFNSDLNKDQPQWTFWGNTTIWVVDADGKARAVTQQSPDEIHTLRWLNNNEIVFDRSPDKQFYSNVRLWKVRIE